MNDKIIGLSSLCFDLSVYDLFGTLSRGGTLVIINDQRIWKNKNKIIENITIWNSFRLLWNFFWESIEPNYIIRWKIVLAVGDVMVTGYLKIARKIKTRFNNPLVISLGGATEAAIWSNITR